MNNRFNIDFDAPARKPYRVPEGYFDTLNERIMQNVPEERKPRRFFLYPMRWAAAAACVAAVCVVCPYLTSSNGDELASVGAADGVVADEFADEDFSYAVISNGDILTYLDENY